jgi:hypothetical protein
MNMNKAAVAAELRGVGKRYGRHIALNGIDRVLRAGELADPWQPRVAGIDMG